MRWERGIFRGVGGWDKQFWMRCEGGENFGRVTKGGHKQSWMRCEGGEEFWMCRKGGQTILDASQRGGHKILDLT